MNSYVLASILKHLKAMPTFDQLGIERYRNLLEISAKAFQPEKGTVFKPLTIGNISAEWVLPRNMTGHGAILFLHGGGYIAGSINSHRDLCSRIAKESGTRVLVINYRLAPENPYPSGLEDAVSAYRWLLENGFAHDSLALAGDSAGGGLTLALLGKIREIPLPMPCAAALLSPWTDLENKNNSIFEKEASDPMLDKRMLDRTAELYCSKTSRSDPFVSPLNCSLKGFCPILIHVGENEVLLDDSRLLVEKGKKAGIKIDINIYENMFHVFQYFARYLPVARDSINKTGAFLQHELNLRKKQ